MPRNNPRVPLRNRFKAALALKGESVASWARGNQQHESLVWMNLSGERHSPEIRAAIAAELGISPADLDAEIAAERPAA